MLKITRVSPNRIDLELSGGLDADTMRTGLDELIAKSEYIESGLMLYTINEFAMPSAGALAIEFTRLPKLFGLIGKFDRCAVLSDAAWLRKAAEIEGALIPGLEVKGFELGQNDAAEEWLAGGNS
jgi:hypothetical protein